MSVVAIYEDANFQGASAELDVGQYDWGQLGIGNDSLSSLKVKGGYTIPNHPRLSGEHKGFDQPNLGLGYPGFSEFKSGFKRLQSWG